MLDAWTLLKLRDNAADNLISFQLTTIRLFLVVMISGGWKMRDEKMVEMVSPLNTKSS